MKTLVLGGAGYIGSHVVKEFLDKNHDVVVYDNLSTGQEVNLFEKARFVKGDILDTQKLKSLMQEGFDSVIFLAGKKAVGESMENPEKYSENNIIGAVNVLNLMQETGVNNLVFSSSAAVYGMPEYLPVDEKHPVNPISYYGYTKLAMENMMSWYCQTKGLKYISLRYFNAVGYDMSGAIKGREKNPQNLLPIIMEVVDGIREKVQVYGSDYETRDGTCIRDYIHVSDLSSAHLLAAEKLVSGSDSKVLNLGTSKGTTVKEILDAVEEVLGKKVKYDFSPRRAGDPATLVASSSLAQSFLNWEPKITDIKDIIKSNLELS